MIEVMSHLNSQEKLKLPKNIRQIGLPEEKKKIYVEDYVVTYMNQLASEYPNRQSAAVLLGFHTKQEDVRLTFINGAIGIPSASVDEDQVSFCSALWEDIYETMRKYFKNSEIVGWFLTRPGKSLGINEKITKIHVDQFPGRDKTLFLMDPMDREDAFFIYEGGKLVQQHGYYIYYERNEDMQSYMVEHGKGKGSEEGVAAADLRKSSSRRKEETEVSASHNNKGKGKKIAGTMVAAMAVVVLGMTLMNRFYMPEGAKSVSGTVSGETVTVKVVEGDLEVNKKSEFSETDTVQRIEEESEDSALETEASAVSGRMTTKHYTVRKGDTLANISLSLYDSRQYVDTICEINDIEDPDVIYEGMVLELP